MRKKIGYIMVCITLILLLSSVSYSQYIIAGQHGVNDVYTDVEPDESLQAWLSPFSMTDSLKYDIDHDGHYDFKVSVNGFYAMGAEGEGCYILPLNPSYPVSYVATHVDSTWHYPSTWVLTNVPNIYNNGDTIDTRLNFTSTVTTFTSWAVGGGLIMQQCTIGIIKESILLE